MCTALNVHTIQCVCKCACVRAGACVQPSLKAFKRERERGSGILR